MNRNRKTNPQLKDVPIVSVFCGSGGLDLGFRRAGFRPVLAMDVAAAAVETYKYNLPRDQRVHAVQQDLSQISAGLIRSKLREVGVTEQPIGVVGGPPCQAFSLGNAFKTTDDPRSKLPASYAKILTELNDKGTLHFFLFENVRGLRQQHSDILELFKRRVGKDFCVFEQELDAQRFGVPQQRKRIFVVGFNRQLYPHLAFDFPTGNDCRVTVRDAIAGLPDPVYFERGLDPSAFPEHPNHWCMRPRSKQFTNGNLKPGEIKGRPFRVLAWDRPSWTVAYGHREVHVHPSGKRRLSIFEAMLLQGYPRTYELRGTLSEQIRLVSDAVPPPVAEALARVIRGHLRLPHTDQQEVPCQGVIANSTSYRAHSSGR